jgi:poly-gamma-glutamate capsule biosynthesis protein CapA/YwtB (metallophosphatase superfamily)
LILREKMKKTINTMRNAVVKSFAAKTRPHSSSANVVFASMVVASYAAILLPAQLQAQEQKAITPEEFSLTLTGDSIITIPASVRENDAPFMGVVKAIKQGDARFTNVEESYPGHNTPPAATSGNGWMTADPSMLKELQWMGFNLFGMANNHSFDWGVQGVEDTIQVLRQNNAVYAGIGETLGEARQPGYLSTPHGRVALIDCASTFLESAPAGDPRPDVRGRPGLNPLRHQTIYNVDASSFETLQKIKDALKLTTGGGGRISDASQTVSFPTIADPVDKYSPVTFRLSKTFSVETHADPHDLAEITHSIRDAKSLANVVVTSIHAHEGVPGPDAGKTPAQFLVEFAHAAVDAGTDVFAGTGPQQLRPIEIYKGKVIFYSLGVLWFQNRQIRIWPSDLYEWYGLGADARPSDALAFRTRIGGGDPHAPHNESVVAQVIFRNGHPSEVILTPITISVSPDMSDYGTPRLADLETAVQILKYLQEISRPYGTEIAIKNGIGYITVGESHQ